MRNLRDQAVVQTAGATRETLLGSAAPAARPVAMAATKPKPPVKTAAITTTAPPPAPAPPAPAVASPPLPVPKIETHTVAVIRSGKASEQVFVRDGDTWVEKGEQKR